MDRLKRQLEAIYVEYQQQLFTFALSMTKSPDFAEDAIHNAFSRLLSLREPPRNLKSYVFRSVGNAAMDIMRRTSRLSELTEEQALAIFDGADDPRQTAEKQAFSEQVQKALENIPEGERLAIVHHLYAELTFREIAEITGCPLATVSTRYRRGMEKLRQELEVAE